MTSSNNPHFSYLVNSTKCSNGYSNLTIMELVDERSEQQDVMIAFYINVTINATRFWILYAFTFFGIILVFFAESSEAYRDGLWRYFTSKENWLDFGNLLCAGICLFLTGTKYKDTAVWFGSTSVLLSWFIIALSIGDMPIVGNWVYLLGNTVKKVTTFLLVFMPLLFGFGLRFRFMFPDKVCNSKYRLHAIISRDLYRTAIPVIANYMHFFRFLDSWILCIMPFSCW